MNGHSTISGCLISVFVLSTFDIWNHICVGSSITLGILGTLAHFRHFSGLSGLGIFYNYSGHHWGLHGLMSQLFLE